MRVRRQHRHRHGRREAARHGGGRRHAPPVRVPDALLWRGRADSPQTGRGARFHPLRRRWRVSPSPVPSAAISGLSSAAVAACAARCRLLAAALPPLVERPGGGSVRRSLGGCGRFGGPLAGVGSWCVAAASARASAAPRARMPLPLPPAPTRGCGPIETTPAGGSGNGPVAQQINDVARACCFLSESGKRYG